MSTVVPRDAPAAMKHSLERRQTIMNTVMACPLVHATCLCIPTLPEMVLEDAWTFAANCVTVKGYEASLADLLRECQHKESTIEVCTSLADTLDTASV